MSRTLEGIDEDLEGIDEDTGGHLLAESGGGKAHLLGNRGRGQLARHLLARVFAC